MRGFGVIGTDCCRFDIHIHGAEEIDHTICRFMQRDSASVIIKAKSRRLAARK